MDKIIKIDQYNFDISAVLDLWALKLRKFVGFGSVLSFDFELCENLVYDDNKRNE